MIPATITIQRDGTWVLRWIHDGAPVNRVLPPGTMRDVELAIRQYGLGPVVCELAQEERGDSPAKEAI